MNKLRNNSNKIHSFSWKIFDFLTQKNCLMAGKSYLISVSGGSDSVALARVFFDIQKKQKIKIVLVYFHHGLRQNSDKEELFVRNLAKKWGAGYHFFKNTNIQKPAVQEKSRKWRYQELNKLKNIEGLDFVVLGHHLDDLAETQIWKLLRGTSLFDLVSMLPVQDYLLRPLLYASKTEIKNYLQDIDQTWIEDTSNLSINYTRNYIRHQIIPKMKNTFLKEGETSESFLQKMLNLHKEAGNLKTIYQNQTLSVTKKTKLTFKEIQSLPMLFAQRLLHDFFLANGVHKLLRVQINNTYQLVMQNKGNWRLQIGTNYIVCGKEKKLFLKNKNIL